MKKLVLIYSILCLSLSCQETEHVQEVPETQIVDYQSFSKELGSILAQVSSNMRSKGVKITNVYQFKVEVNNVLTSNENFESSFDASYHYVSTLAGVERRKVEKKKVYVTQYQYDVLNRIDELWLLSTTPDRYKDGLDLLLTEVVASEAKVEEKNSLLIHLSSQLVAHEFVESNLDLLGLAIERSRGGSWWDDWGRCAAGIIGGAGVGALTGCGVGVTAGLGFASIPGCGVGAIAGGIIGASAEACANGSMNCPPTCHVKTKVCNVESESECDDEDLNEGGGEQ